MRLDTYLHDLLLSYKPSTSSCDSHSYVLFQHCTMPSNPYGT